MTYKRIKGYAFNLDLGQNNMLVDNDGSPITWGYFHGEDDVVDTKRMMCNLAQESDPSSEQNKKHIHGLTRNKVQKNIGVRSHLETQQIFQFLYVIGMQHTDNLVERNYSFLRKFTLMMYVSISLHFTNIVTWA